LVTAALTCPCHLPIYLLVLGGTSVGVVLQGNLGLAFLGTTTIFLFTLYQGLRRSSGGGTQSEDRALSSKELENPDRPLMAEKAGMPWDRRVTPASGASVVAGFLQAL
jgi:mercuric ion transport protein